jgi:1-acyl-sn-glycerol-3-phosphate acyltransferase
VAYWFLKAVLTPILYLFWRVEVEGRDHVPSAGPVILAANHQSFCDSFVLPLVVRRRVTYVAKAEYFEDWKTAWFFRAVGQIPMNRGGGDKSQRALDTATRVLEGGGVLGIYPEGTRSPDVRLHKGHTGVARLALGCGAPVVPVGIIGTRKVQPPGCRMIRAFHPVTLRFGPPIDTSAVQPTAARQPGGPGGQPDSDALRSYTDALMTAIAGLSGQEYVDEYANRSKGSTGQATRGDNGAPGTAAARAVRAKLRKTSAVIGRKPGVHNDGVA